MTTRKELGPRELLDRFGYITEKDLAALLGITVKTLQNKPASELPRFVRASRRQRLFEVDSVQTYMARRSGYTCNGDLDDGGSDDEAEESLTLELSPLGFDGWIYCIQGGATSPVKIGFTRDVSSRLDGLQTGSPDQLVVLAKVRGTVADERLAHERLAPYRRLREWFEWAKPVQRFVTALTSGATVRSALDAAESRD